MFYSGGPISLLFLYISVHLAKVIALELSHNTLLPWSPLEPNIFQKSVKGRHTIRKQRVATKKDMSNKTTSRVRG
jgi:hypothetical protein